MNTKKMLKILHPYCDRIRYNGMHYVCYPKGLKRIITFSASPSDRHWYHQLFNEFRRCGIIITELQHSHAKKRG